MRRFIRENGIKLAMGLGLALLAMIFILSLTSCSEDELIEEVILENEVLDIEIFVTDVGVNLEEYTDILLWLLLNPDDDYKFYYRDGLLYELEVSTSIVEEWELIAVIQQVVDSLTVEEIEGLTANIN